MVFIIQQIRTFLIRNGLSILFKDGPAAYKTYYLRYGLLSHIYVQSWGCEGPEKTSSLAIQNQFEYLIN